MKKRLQGVIVGTLIGLVFTSGMVFAKQTSELAEIYYNNIKIFIDGGEIVPKDANGNSVEPFIMNGTTYLPVRAISNAFEQAVEWDGGTQSIYIGKKDETMPDDYLHKIQYTDFLKGIGDTRFAILNGTVTDFNDNVYTKGLLFYIARCESHNAIQTDYMVYDEDYATALIEYSLDSQYSRLTGKIVLPKEYKDATLGEDEQDATEADVLFYGDGKLIHKATGVTASMPFDFDIKVKGVNQLVIKIRLGDNWSSVCIADPALYK